MVGSRLRKCENGEWDGQKPVCFGLNQENEYARKHLVLLRTHIV
jgi:hypothetical protein